MPKVNDSQQERLRMAASVSKAMEGVTCPYILSDLRRLQAVILFMNSDEYALIKQGLQTHPNFINFNLDEMTLPAEDVARMCA